MGSLIIQEVVKALLPKGLDGAKVLLLAGSRCVHRGNVPVADPKPPDPMCVRACSAGGTGVLLNVDRVSELLEGLGHSGIHVRGLADSGWFLDNKQYDFTDCLDALSCAPTETIKRGIK